MHMEKYLVLATFIGSPHEAAETGEEAAGQEGEGHEPGDEAARRHGLAIVQN